MLNLLNLLISPALAQDAPPISPDGGAAAFMNYLPFILIFAVFYFLVIRPQQKKLSEQEKMIKALQKGDRVITTGGIYGKITKFEGDNQLFLEIADNVQIKIERSHISSLEAKPQPVSQEVEKK